MASKRIARLCVVAVLSSTGLLAACSGSGGGEDDPQTPPPPDLGSGPDTGCVALSGGDTSITFENVCTGCRATDEPKAIDGDFDTKAVVSFDDGGAADVAMIATAQDGVVYPAGSLAGAFYDFAGNNQIGLTVRLRTYLDGEVQDQGDFEVNTVGGGSGQRHSNALRATMPYDAVGIAMTRTSGTAATLGVYEFCVDQ